MSEIPQGTSRQQAQGNGTDRDASRVSRTAPAEMPAYQEFRASVNKVFAARVREPSSQEAQRTRWLLEQGQTVQMLRCSCCTRTVYDGWKAVHCEHIICVDCMVRSSEELIHCQVCIIMCGEDRQHNTCMVCFGCELLCRCPERLELFEMHANLRYRIAGRKPPEFYKRITMVSQPAAVRRTNLTVDVADVPGKDRSKKKGIEREKQRDHTTPEKLRRLNAKQHRMEERVKYLENCLMRLQSKVEQLMSARPPEAQVQQQQQPMGMHQVPLQEASPVQQASQTPDSLRTQTAPQRYASCDPMAPTFAQFANSYREEYPAFQDGFPQLPVFDAMRQAIRHQTIPENGEGPPRRAFVAVVQMNSRTADTGMFDPVKHIARSGQQNYGSIGSSIVIREISNNDEGEYQEDFVTEPSSSSNGNNPVLNLQSPSTVKSLPKKNAETTVQTLVAQLAQLYDKVAALECDNEKLRDDQRNLQKANAEMRKMVKDVQCEQARSRQTLPMDIQQLMMQTQIIQPQQAMSVCCDPGGTSATAVKVGVDAFLENSGTQETTTSSTSRSNDASKSSDTIEARNTTIVEDEINIVVQSSPGGEIFLNNKATSATALAFAHAPTAASAPRPTNRKSLHKSNTSLPSYSRGQELTDSELETYKRRVNDIMDWYQLCKRREAYLEQTTLAYLRETLNNSCHFLDYGHPFCWELDECLKLSSGKTCFRDFRIFSGPVIDLLCRGLIRFVVDPLPSSICVYVEILISAKPKADQYYVLRVRDADSRKDFHHERYKSEDMFGFRGVLTYPGTPCLGFFSIVVQVDHDDLPPTFRNNGRLLIELTKTRYDK